MDKKSNSVTVSARSVDEAVDQALQRLGLSHEQVEIEVIKRGSRGLLGLLSEDAVVEVTAKAPSPPPVVETAVPAAAVQKAETVPEPPPAADHDEIARIGTEVLQNLLDYMALHARIAREESPDLVRLNVMGKDLGVLIGRRGETLRDLQYLTCLLVSRRRQRWPNLIVDVEHYKSRRESCSRTWLGAWQTGSAAPGSQCLWSPCPHTSGGSCTWLCAMILMSSPRVLGRMRNAGW